MAITIAGVTCQVMSSGYGEHAGPDGQGVTRGYLCDWDQRFIVAHALLGLVNYSGTGGGGTVSFEHPMGLDELPNVLALSVRIEGKGMPYQNDAGLGYTYAVVWCEYGMPPWSSGGEAQISQNDSFVYATQELDSSNQYITIPGQVLQYTDSGLPSTIDRNIVVTEVELRITFNRMPYVPMPALAYADRVNDALFLGIPRGHVKFDGIKVSRDHSAGQVLQKAAYQFTYRPIAEHNQIPSATVPGTWTLLKYKGTTVYPYAYTDMRAIWPGQYWNSV